MKSIDRQYCCEMMKDNSEFTCTKCKDMFECPDTLIYHNSQEKEYGIIIHDGGTSFMEIQYCPWCGTEL